LTEVERYETKGKGKHGNKKKSPQEMWVELLAASGAEAPAHLRHYMSDLSTCDNVPRKEKQFKNFVANSMKIPKHTVQEIWDILKQRKEEDQQRQSVAKEQIQNTENEQTKSEQGPTGGDAESGDSAEAMSADKAEQGETAVTMGNSREQSENDADVKLPSPDEIKKVMKKILKKEKGNAMPFKSLRKAVCSKYGVEKKGKKQMKKLLTDNLSGKKFVVDGKVVRLKID
jgi:hypothetical protein